MYTLFFDSDSDVTLKEANSFGAKLISMPYVVDGEEVYPYVDFETFDSHEFYEMLRGGVLPTTCALSSENYRVYFEEELKQGRDILYVHLSRAMTVSIDAKQMRPSTLNGFLL